MFDLSKVHERSEVIERIIAMAPDERMRFRDRHSRSLDEVRKTVTRSHPFWSRRNELLRYDEFWSAFAYYMLFPDGRPAGLSDHEFLMFKRYAEHMVESGLWQPERLRVFDGVEEPPIFRP
jgi:hypothetical protein